MKKISVDNFKGDPLFPKIQTAVAQLLEREKGIVTPVSVFVALGNLNPKEVEAWRRRQIPFLEKAVQGNLAKISRILRILRFHGHDLLLIPSWTGYSSWGKRKTPLRFTKTGDSNLERVWATHFLSPSVKKDLHQDSCK